MKHTATTAIPATTATTAIPATAASPFRRGRRARRGLLAAPAIAAVALLAACSGGSDGSGDDSNAGAATDPASTATGASNSAHTTASETPASSDDSASGEATANGVTAKVSPVDGIVDGSEVTIELSGLNPAYGGYYLGFCGDRPEGSPAPACTGDRAVPGTQAWLSNRGGSQPVPGNGEATVTLTGKASGEGVDCRADSCTLKVFGDHSEGFEDIVDVPVTFAP
ncbi:thiamine biosynthesis protein [Corynebacterium xerosis]|uniref:Thiamine biosynthesis protein n=1 Tax=Corynebacterium xerosis TaxID=1725 RepID=A0A6B8TCF6_9CORY|nr:thiamine biosynthesis protein [Corynebacterium xerosis]QGS34557.1 thiamine biosynthesis protein [Corynebacterium xerosis]